MSLLFSACAVGLYLLATGLIFARLSKRATGDEAGKGTALGVWAAAALAHGLAIYVQMAKLHGFNLGFFSALSVVALLMSVLVLISAINRPLENLGLILLPLAAACAALGQFVETSPLIPATQHIQTHVFVSLLAYSILTIAALQALLLWAQERQLHNHQPGGLIRALPPMQWMEDLLFRLIALGVVLLGLALASGFFFLEDVFAQHLAHKTVLSIAAWLLFVMLLLGRWRFGWRGPTAVRWTLFGFFVLMLAYFGSKLVLELVLQRS
ncbi:MAG: cytochrome C assembly family protein [Gammaproteobacteria bacterium]